MKKKSIFKAEDLTMELFFNSFLVMFVSAVIVMFVLSLYLYLYLD
jgi:hypothetical protein